MSRKAFIFPGQGAQVVGMGRDFSESFSAAREVFEEASDVLSFNYRDLIFSGPIEELSQTKFAQPAIFITSVAILKVVKSQFLELQPAICAGLSLGEYTALYAAGKIGFAEGLKLVAARGAFMQEACKEAAGTMRVVLGIEPGKVQEVLPENIWIANLNCPGQVVIAGKTADMQAAEEALKAAGAKRVLPIDVSGAFHTPLMRSAQLKLEPLLKSANIQDSSIELVMNVPGNFVKTTQEIRTNLIDQVASPTKWEQGVRTMDATGVEQYLEMGPGKTLAGMNKKIGVKAPTISIEKVTDLEAVHA